MKFDYSKTINEQLDVFDYYKNRYANYELTILKLQRENNDLKKQLASNGIVKTCENCEWFGICPHSYREYDYKNECERLRKVIKKAINEIETGYFIDVDEKYSYLETWFGVDILLNILKEVE